MDCYSACPGGHRDPHTMAVTKKKWTKATWGIKGLLQIYSSTLKEVRAERQGKHMEAGAEAEAMKECCLLAFSPLLTQPAF